MLMPTGKHINLNHSIYGFRADHIVHSTIFVPYMIFIGLINNNLSIIELLKSKLFIALGFGALCETFHLFLPYRSFSIFDYFANCFGITIGLVLFISIGKYIQVSEKN
ncbi:MAG: VanZ family protein [Crocinitomicaceae bacterium]|nr:VanZ family protein [Crocinitomicaceae bacterium]